MLDRIMISSDVGRAWQAVFSEAIRSGALNGIPAESIPDEDARLNENDVLEIFVCISHAPDNSHSRIELEIKMEVPDDQWAWIS